VSFEQQIYLMIVNLTWK